MNFTSNKCIAIRVTDLDEAKKFYRDVLAFKMVGESDTTLEFDTGTFCLYVEKSKSVEPPVPSFTVASSEAAKDHLIQNGCKIKQEFKGGFWFEDPFGIVFDVIEE